MSSTKTVEIKGRPGKRTFLSVHDRSANGVILTFETPSTNPQSLLTAPGRLIGGAMPAYYEYPSMVVPDNNFFITGTQAGDQQINIEESFEDLI